MVDAKGYEAKPVILPINIKVIYKEDEEEEEEQKEEEEIVQ